MALDQLTDEQREAFLEYKAANYSTAQAMVLFYEDFPEARPYAERTFNKYMATKEARIAYNRILKERHDQAKQESFARSEARVAAYCEICQKIFDSLRELKATDQPFVPLNREFRETLTKIRDEDIPVEALSVRSAIEDLILRTKDTPFQAIVLDTIQPTQNN